MACKKDMKGKVYKMDNDYVDNWKKDCKYKWVKELQIFSYVETVWFKSVRSKDEMCLPSFTNCISIVENFFNGD